jgi:hypothetical protein
MGNTPLALAGPPAAGSLKRAPLNAWTMGNPRSTSPEAPKKQLSAEPLDEIAPDYMPSLVHSYTLRVKPDRRRVQLPIPPGLDRRRPRD